MSLLQKLWGRPASPAPGQSSPVAHRSAGIKQAMQAEADNFKVAEISDGQPFNPYTEMQILTDHKDVVRKLCVIDKKRFASASDDTTVIIWSIEHGCKLHCLSQHSRPITCLLALHSEQNSTILITAASDKLLCIWDVDSGNCLKKVEEHKSSIKCMMSMCVDERELICTADKSVCLWDEFGNLLANCRIASLRNYVCGDASLMIRTKNSKVVVSAERDVVVCSVCCEDADVQIKIVHVQLQQHREAILSLVNISESCFASGSLDGCVCIWSAHNLCIIRKFEQAAFSHDEHNFSQSVQFLLPFDEKYLFVAAGCGFALYNVVSKKLIALKRNAHFSKILHLQLLANGAFLVTCSEDGSIRLWGYPYDNSAPISFDDWLEMSVVQRFIGQQHKPDRSELLKAKSQEIFEPTLLGECLAHSGAVQMLINIGNNGFASCGMDGLVIIWKDATLQSVRRQEFLRNQF